MLLYKKVFLIVLTCSRTHINLLVPKDYSFDTRSKQNHRTEIWIQEVKELKVAQRSISNLLSYPVRRSKAVSFIVGSEQNKDTNKWSSSNG